MKLCHIDMDKFMSKTKLQYQKNLSHLTEVQWDISDQNRDINIISGGGVKNFNNISLIIG